MKVAFKLFIILIISTPPGVSHAFPELPFCPAGGPPGWLNYFNYKRDQNMRRHYAQYTLPVNRQTGYYPPRYGYRYTPVYQGYPRRPNQYFLPPRNYWQKSDPSRPAPQRIN